MGTAAYCQVNLRLVLEQNMTVLVENGVSQLAPVPLLAVFIVYIVIIDADRKPGVVCDSVFLNGRGIGQYVAGSIRKEVELCDFLPCIYGQNRAGSVMLA